MQPKNSKSICSKKDSWLPMISLFKSKGLEPMFSRNNSFPSFRATIQWSKIQKVDILLKTLCKLKCLSLNKSVELNKNGGNFIKNYTNSSNIVFQMMVLIFLGILMPRISSEDVMELQMLHNSFNTKNNCLNLFSNLCRIILKKFMKINKEISQSYSHFRILSIKGRC